jgi:Protein of unknown function (DUF2726)
MDPLYIPLAAVALAVVAVLLWRVLGKRHAARPRLPYTKRASLLTPAEQRFYRVLLQAVPQGLTAFVKVRLLDVVNVPDRAWRQYGAPASGMHLDFVLADAATTEVRLVIELDDRTHQRPEVQERDRFKDDALASAGVPILRVQVGWYDACELRARIAAAKR